MAITPYIEAELLSAQKDYLAREEEIEDERGYQACLVSVASIKALPRAYPNYYLDTTKFIDTVTRVLGR